MEIQFEQTRAAWWLIAIGLVLALAVVEMVRRRALLDRFAAAGTSRRLLPTPRRGRAVVRMILLSCALVLMVLALMDPRWGRAERPLTRRGIDLVVVLDISKSMLAEDVSPNRLDRAKRYIEELVETARGDRMALVTFAGTPVVRCPLTVDTNAFIDALRLARPETAPRGGSLIGDAIRVAAQSFRDDDPDHKAIVIFSDGEDHGSFPLAAAERHAEEIGIPIHTVGIGSSTDGGRIPVERNGRREWLVYDGEVVRSRLEEAALRDIALRAGGAYIPAGVASVSMGEMYETIIEPVAVREYEETRARTGIVRYQWFAVAALILLMLETAIVPRPHGVTGREVRT